MAYDRFNYSARTFYKFIKDARKFADMDAAEKIRKKDVAAAILSRDLEKDKNIMAVL